MNIQFGNDYVNIYKISIEKNLEQDYKYSIIDRRGNIFSIRKIPLINKWNTLIGETKINDFGMFLVFNNINFIPKTIDFEDNFLNYIFDNYSISFIRRDGDVNSFHITIKWVDVYINNKRPPNAYLFGNDDRIFPHFGPIQPTVVTTATTSVNLLPKSGGLNKRKMKKLKIVF